MNGNSQGLRVGLAKATASRKFIIMAAYMVLAVVWALNEWTLGPFEWVGRGVIAYLGSQGVVTAVQRGVEAWRSAPKVPS